MKRYNKHENKVHIRLECDRDLNYNSDIILNWTKLGNINGDRKSAIEITHRHSKAATINLFAIKYFYERNKHLFLKKQKQKKI